MPIFMLPLLKRVIGPSRSGRSICIELDGRGVYVNDLDLRLRDLFGCLVGVADDYCYIEAETVEEAILSFHSNWVGANTGRSVKALVINREQPVLEYPPCSRIKLDNEGRFLCIYSDEPDYVPCDCILNKGTPPDVCPIERFLSSIHGAGLGTIPRFKDIDPFGTFLVVSPGPSYTQPVEQATGNPD